jgi:phospholipid/cholesterol/gamma-HCH transport system substrate-binding protein
MRRFTLLVLVLALGATGCSIRTAGSPKGDLELFATFDDVSNLVVGHSVQIADVTVGTVTDIDLVDDRRARVTMSLEEGHPLPVGTSARLNQTSLLGEQYVELRPPPEGLAGPPLESGDEIGETSISADFETVTERAIEFLGAIGAQDVQTLVSTGARAIGGRGDDLHELLADLSTVVVDLDSQRTEIVQTIEGFARLGRDLAQNDDQVVQLVDDLSGASVTLAENRERIIGALRGIRDMTQITNQAVLADHTDDLITTIQNLDPILATLQGQRPIIDDAMTTTVDFLRAIADNLIESSTPGQAQYVWTRGIATPSGTLGEGEGPPQPEPPEGDGPDPAAIQAQIQQTLSMLLGLLGDPNLRLPAPLCRHLRSMQLGLDLQAVCGPPAGQPSQPSGPPVDPTAAIDDILGGLPG